MDSLLLPGTIPGLLVRGCPVVVVDIDDEPGACDGSRLAVGDSGVVTSAPQGARGWGIVTGDTTSGEGPAWSELPVDGVALDLTDPAGVDRAARWVAEKLGHVVGATAPRWEGIGEHRWYMGIGTGKPAIYFTPDEIPTLATIDLADPNADTLALIEVVRFLAGVS